MPSSQRNGVLQLIQRFAEAECTRKLTDRQLLERFLVQRDEAAFAALIRRHGPMVLRLCRRVLQNEDDAEDAFQATFLALSRQACSLRQHESLVGWLHRVACRVAHKARIAAARRRKHEDRAAQRQGTDPLTEITLREAHEFFDRELNRLPDKFRAPLVLCYLQGLTRDEAAQRLGWPPSTLKSRLEQARERLRARLESRRIALSGALVAALFCESTAAAVPRALLGSTVKAAIAVAAGEAATSVVSPQVVALAEGVVKTMFITKLSFVASMVVLAVVAMSAGGLLYQTQAAAQPPPREERSIARSPQRGAEQTSQEAVKTPWKQRLMIRMPGGDFTLSMAISPDGKRIATGHGGAGKLWDAGQGKAVAELDLNGITCLAFSPDGKIVAGGNGRFILNNDAQIKLVRLWDTTTGQERATLLGHAGSVDCLAFSPDGKILATGADPGDTKGRAIRLWDVASAKESTVEIKFSGYVASLTFSPDGKALAAGVDDGAVSIKLWDVKTGKELAAWKEDQQGVAPENWARSLVFFPDGKTLAAGYRDGTVRLWDVATGKERGSLPCPRLVHLALSPDGKTLVTAGHVDPTIKLWNVAEVDIAKISEIQTIEDHTGLIWSVAFAEKAGILATGGDDAVRLWELSKEPVKKKGEVGPDGKPTPTPPESKREPGDEKSQLRAEDLKNLLKALKDEDADVREAAIEALKKLDKEEEAKVRLEAIKALGEIRLTTTIVVKNVLLTAVDAKQNTISVRVAGMPGKRVWTDRAEVKDKGLTPGGLYFVGADGKFVHLPMESAILERLPLAKDAKLTINGKAAAIADLKVPGVITFHLTTDGAKLEVREIHAGK